MKFTQTSLSGSYVVEIEQLKDARGFFARSWCAQEFAQHGLPENMVQSSISFNLKAGTLRGMHYSVFPAEESKLVRCTKGSIYDVIVDIRRGSDTYLNHFGITLSEQNHKALFIPSGFAHGFLTLEQNTEVLYMMNDYYKPDCARGCRWNDPLFNISWPNEIKVIAERDRNYPDFAIEES